MSFDGTSVDQLYAGLSNIFLMVFRFDCLPEAYYLLQVFYFFLNKGIE